MPDAPARQPARQPTGQPDRFRSGSGRLCLDYLRTLRLRGSADATEELDTPRALAAWVRQFGPYPAELAVPEPSVERLAQAQALREGVHALLSAARGEGVGSCPTPVRLLLNQVAAEPVPVPALDAHGQLRHGADDPVAALLAAVARDAVDLACSPALARVRACTGEHCAAWFLDSSRPGNRRWCSMDTCGNQAKKSAWRGKQTAVHS
jgi:predicted RNA-binding Zn ribbon-like protein